VRQQDHLARGRASSDRMQGGGVVQAGRGRPGDRRKVLVDDDFGEGFRRKPEPAAASRITLRA
jgi:hypothetical protein